MGKLDTAQAKSAVLTEALPYIQDFRGSVVLIRGAGTKGKQLSTKPIARISGAKGGWWDENEPKSKGVLD